MTITLIGLRIPLSKAKAKEPRLTLSGVELEALRERIGKNQLSKQDIDSVLKIIDLLVYLNIQVQKGRNRLLRVINRIFGKQTEKDSKPKKTGSNQSGGGGRRGRNGRDDYPGAEKTFVEHPTLKPNDPCPECFQGKLREEESGVDYAWQGNTPLVLNVYLLQRLICHACKVAFTAPSPVQNSSKTVDDSGNSKKVTKCNRNAFANAVVACLRYMFGIPFYRLGKIQSQMGVPLPEATQYAMVTEVFEAGKSIYEELIYQAAQGSLLMADDTAIKILDWLRGKGPPKKNGESRKTAQTSAIVSKTVDGKTIILYLTDEKQAGKHIQRLLDVRKTSAGIPIYMCDALQGNLPSDAYRVIQVHCLDHGRRLFYDIKNSFPKECQHVLDSLAIVYKVDKEAKMLGLDHKKRLTYHKEHSASVMKDLGKWMKEKIESEEVEENSDLGHAMKYFLKRWSQMTEFLNLPGVPLSNAECERVIKLIITHRKNSLFYKTSKGAHVGDVIQSLVATCQKINISPFKYLPWIQENKTKAAENPAEYLPWCMPT